MPRRIEDFRGLKQASRVRLLHAVQRIPGQKLADLAEIAGIHINTARDHMNVLEEEGFIFSRPIDTGSRGRPPVAFYPVQQPGINPNADQRAQESQTRGNLLRRLYPSDEHRDEMGEAAQYQIDTLYAHLEDVGLEPVLDPDNRGISVQPCQYHDMLEDGGSMVCAVHARLIQDQLSQVPGPLHMKQLKPFVTPHECRVTLCDRGYIPEETLFREESGTSKTVHQETVHQETVDRETVDRKTVQEETVHAQSVHEQSLNHVAISIEDGATELQRTAEIYDAALVNIASHLTDSDDSDAEACAKP